MIITINGNVENSMNGTLSINEMMNSRNTVSFNVRTENNIEVGQSVTIVDGSITVFGGTIDTHNVKWLQGDDTGNRKVYSINCIDYNQLLDKGIKVATTYTDTSVNDIITDTSNERTIGSLLAQEGITIGTISGGDVVIKRAVFNYLSISGALDYIKDVTGLNWNVSYDKELTLFYRSDNVGVMDSSKFYMITKEVTRQEYRNSQIVKAGKGHTELQELENPTPKPDGVSRNFILRYPVALKPRIFVDSAEVAESDIGINGVDAGKEWYYTYGSRNLVQDLSEVVLSDAKSLSSTYTGLRDINIQSKSAVGIEERLAIETGSSGIYEEVEQKQELDSQTAAVDYADGLLLKYAEIPERVYIESSEYISSGLIVPLVEEKVNVNGEYLVESVSISEDGGQLRYYYVLASGEALGSWVEFFRKLANDATDFTINDNEVLVILAKFTESWTLREDSLTATVVTYKTPADDLYSIVANQFYSGVGSTEVII